MSTVVVEPPAFSTPETYQRFLDEERARELAVLQDRAPMPSRKDIPRNTDPFYSSIAYTAGVFGFAF